MRGDIHLHPYVFMAWYLVKHRDSFILTYGYIYIYIYIYIPIGQSSVTAVAPRRAATGIKLLLSTKIAMGIYRLRKCAKLL
jgi:hypothetical protein